MATVFIESHRQQANNARKKTSREVLPPKLPIPGERNALNKSARLLTYWIETTLDTGRVHFWRGPQLLTTLDEVVNAFLDRQLEIEWTFILTGSFEEVEAQTRELRYFFRVTEEREEATGECWRRVLRTGRVRY